MKPAPFGYARPDTVDAAVRALAAFGPGAKVLAGGQSLIPLLSMRLASPSHLVDINGIAELGYVRVSGGQVAVGALARHAAVLGDQAARAAQPLLATALRFVAHPAIRNRGTTVGSLVHADPAGEMTAVLAVLGGSVRLTSAAGDRAVPASRFFLGPLESDVRPGELATEACFPVLDPGAGTGFAEISRRSGDYAICGVAALVRLGADGLVRHARAAYLGVGPVPVVVDLTEVLAGCDPAAGLGGRAAAAGAGGAPPADALAGAARLARDQLDPEPDLHATAAYRRHLAGVLTQRALADAMGQAADRGVAWGQDPAGPLTPADPLARTGRPAAPGREPERPRPGAELDGAGLREIRLIVNGAAHDVRVPARRLLSDCLRHDLRLTGTHVGCEHGVCGACTVLLDGAPARSCLTLAVTADGASITTVEGLSGPDGTLSPVQQAFADCHGLQCGFCTPGFLTTITAGLRESPDPTREQAIEMISGNLCRCTGYQNIVRAVRRAAGLTRERGGGPEAAR